MRWWPWVAVTVLGSCAGTQDDDVGDSDDETETDGSNLGEPVTAIVGPEGATLSVRGGPGTTLSLEIPAGALLEPTEITVTGIEADGVIATFAVAPAGLLLWAPAVASLRVGEALPERAGFFWQAGEAQTALVGTVDGSTLTAELPFFGFVEAPEEGANLRAPRAGPPALLQVRVLDCDVEIASFASWLRSRTGDPTELAQAWSATEALRDACLATHQVELHSLACSHYAAVELAAQAVAATDHATFKELAGNLVSGKGIVDLATASCDTSRFEGILSDKFDQALTFLAARYARLSVRDDVQSAVDEFVALREYAAACTTFALPDATCGRFEASLYPDALDRLRAGVYGQCVTSGSPQLVSVMYAHRLEASRAIAGTPLRATSSPGSAAYGGFARFSYDQLEDDIGHCASDLEVLVYTDASTVPSELVERSRRLDAAPVPGPPNRETTVLVPRDGSLLLRGDLRALPCPDGTIAPDVLVVRANGAEIARRAPSGASYTLQSSPIDLLMDTVYTRTVVSGAAFDVELSREGTGCGVFRTSQALYTIHVQVEERCVERPFTGTLLTIANAQDLAGAEGYTSIAGSLTISGTDITDLEALNCLQTVGGSLSIAGDIASESLAGLRFLRSVGGSVSLQGVALTSLGLDALTSVGSLDISNNATSFGALPTFTLPALARVDGSLRVGGTGGSLRLVRLPALSVVGGTTTLSGDITSVELPVLAEIGGDLSLRTLSSTQFALSTAANLNVKTDLRVDGIATGPTSVSVRVRDVGGSVLIQSNRSVGAVTFVGLDSVGFGASGFGDLRIDGNRGLGTVTIPGSARVQRNLDVTSNTNQGLAGIGAGLQVGRDFVATNNTGFSDAAASSLAASLSIGRTTTVFGNQ